MRTLPPVSSILLVALMLLFLLFADVGSACKLRRHKTGGSNSSTPGDAESSSPAGQQPPVLIGGGDGPSPAGRQQQPSVNNDTNIARNGTSGADQNHQNGSFHIDNNNNNDVAMSRPRPAFSPWHFWGMSYP